MEKIIKGNKCSILGLAYQQVEIFERLKMNDKVINMVNKFRISKSTMAFKILIVKFVNKYTRKKKSSFSLHFRKNDFKMIKEIYHENASEFK